MNTRKLIPNRPSRAQQGSTLIEVLVTMLVVAIGLLGAAGLQLASTRYQQTAQMRSQGVVQAEFIAEKIRANSNAGIAYLRPDAYANATLAALPADPGCGLTAQPDCTAAQAAIRDLRDWRLSLQQVLPGGRGSIFPLANAGVTDPITRQIVVMWQEKQQNEAGTALVPNPLAAIDPTCPAPQIGGVRCFTFIVSP